VLVVFLYDALDPSAVLHVREGFWFLFSARHLFILDFRLPSPWISQSLTSWFFLPVSAATKLSTASGLQFRLLRR
jgi:hypothetical protein